MGSNNDQTYGLSLEKQAKKHIQLENETGAVMRVIQPGDASDIGWPTLIPLDLPNLPRLDADWLPGWVGAFCKAASEATETPPELAIAMALGTCATACQRRLRVEVTPGYFESTNLWILAALEPGNRKSTIQDTATAPLLTWDQERLSRMEPEIERLSLERAAQDARIKALTGRYAKTDNQAKREQIFRDLDRLKSEITPVPPFPQLWTSDCTPERLGMLLADNEECMAWLSSEGGIFEMLAGRYSGGIPNLDLFLKAWSGDNERVDRAGRAPVILQSPLLSMALSPQPDVLKSLSSIPGFRGRGLLARFLYIIPSSPLGYRSGTTRPIPAGTQQGYDQGIRAMLDWEAGEGLHTVQVSPAGMSEWRDFQQTVERAMRPGELLENYKDWAAKAPGQAIRVAGVLHGMNHAHGRPWEHSISADTMNAALSIMEVIMHHSLAGLRMTEATRGIDDATFLWKWIERHRHPVFTVREAFNGIRGRFQKVADVEAAMSTLAERGYVEVQDSQSTGKPGRPPSPAVMVRPSLAEKW